MEIIKEINVNSIYLSNISDSSGKFSLQLSLIVSVCVMSLGECVYVCVVSSVHVIIVVKRIYILFLHFQSHLIYSKALPMPVLFDLGRRWAL